MAEERGTRQPTKGTLCFLSAGMITATDRAFSICLLGGLLDGSSSGFPAPYFVREVFGADDSRRFRSPAADCDRE